MKQQVTPSQIVAGVGATDPHHPPHNMVDSLIQTASFVVCSIALLATIAGLTLMGQPPTSAQAASAQLPDTVSDSTVSENTIPAFGIQEQKTYIVLFKDEEVGPESNGISISEYSTMLVDLYSGTLQHTYETALQGFAADLTPDAASQIAAMPDVEEVIEDTEIELVSSVMASSISPNATQPSATWGLDRVDQRSLPLNSSYSYNNDASDVHVYVIDTGIRTQHEEFGGRVGNGYSSIRDDNGTNDCHGHGTHVAGTVAGSTYGVAKSAQLYPIRVLSCSGRGTTAGVIAGVDWVTANHRSPAVANMSLGGASNSALDKAVENSIRAGVTYVVAAGNSRQSACHASPARVDEAITIGASTNSDARASFSNYGSCVDLFAPGHNITSAWSNTNSGTKTISGTSMASPHVAGAAALYLQSNPSHAPATVFEAILDQASTGKLSDIGSGSPNLLLYTMFGGSSPTPVPTTRPTTRPTTAPTRVPTVTPTPTRQPDEEDATLYVEGTPITMQVGETRYVDFMVSAGTVDVNGVQINGKLDPRYLKIVGIERNTDKLSQVLDNPQYDASTGTFRYGAGTLNGTVNGTFEVLRVEVEAIATTSGTRIEFVDDFPPTNISGPSGSVMREARDGMVIIEASAGATLAGEVKLQGRPDGESDAKSVPLTVTLYRSGSNTPVTTMNVTTDRNARFSMSNLPTGTYDVQMVNTHTLASRARNVVLNAGRNAVFLGPLMEGDVVQNNQIVIEDFGPFSGGFNRQKGDSGFDERTDLNEDDYTNIRDFALISGNFNKQGDLSYDVGNPPTLPFELPTAKLNFGEATRFVAVGETIDLPIYVDPNGSSVNGVTVNMNFDSNVVEIISVNLSTSQLSTTLLEPMVDATNGVFQFSAGQIGTTVHERFQIATVTLRLKAATFGSSLRFVRNDIDGTEITGIQGSVMDFGSLEGIVLASEGGDLGEDPGGSDELDCAFIIGICPGDESDNDTATQTNNVFLPIVSR
ncbi:MAG: S8 family serine peptidase [Chloroflexota bacterium]